MQNTPEFNINNMREKATGAINPSGHSDAQEGKITALNYGGRGNFSCLDSAIDYFSTLSEMARALHVAPSNVYYWKTKTGLIPADRALRCERVTKGLIKAMDILEENEVVRLANTRTFD